MVLLKCTETSMNRMVDYWHNDIHCIDTSDGIEETVCTILIYM